MRMLRALLAVVGVMICSARAHGQMTPLEDGRENHAFATFLGVTDSQSEFPTAPFAYFNSALARFRFRLATCVD